MNYILTKEIVDRYLQECSIAKELNAHTLKAYQIDLKQFLCFMEPMHTMYKRNLCMPIFCICTRHIRNQKL